MEYGTCGDPSGSAAGHLLARLSAKQQRPAISKDEHGRRRGRHQLHLRAYAGRISFLDFNDAFSVVVLRDVDSLCRTGPDTDTDARSDGNADPDANTYSFRLSS